MMFWKKWLKRSSLVVPQPVDGGVLIKPDEPGDQKYARRFGVVVAKDKRVKRVNVGDRVCYWAGGAESVTAQCLDDYHLVLPSAVKAVMPPERT